MSTETQKVDVLGVRSITHTMGIKVSFQYRQHYLLGGSLIGGMGTIIDRTIVGTDDAYAIKPDDGSEVVHVRATGVRRLA